MSNKPKKDKKNKRPKPISLYPLEPEEVLGDLLKIKSEDKTEKGHQEK